MRNHSLAKRAVMVAWAGVAAGAYLTSFLFVGTEGRLRRAPPRMPDDYYSTLDTLRVACGLAFLCYWIPRLVSRHRTLRDLQRTQDAHFFARAGAPRTIYELLLGVAACDGHVGPDEHAAVTRLLTKELPEKVLPQDLKNWSTSVQRPRDPLVVAGLLTQLLTAAERSTVLQWCREVASADARVDEHESGLLTRLSGALAQ